MKNSSLDWQTKKRRWKGHTDRFAIAVALAVAARPLLGAAVALAFAVLAFALPLALARLLDRRRRRRRLRVALAAPLLHPRPQLLDPPKKTKNPTPSTVSHWIAVAFPIGHKSLRRSFVP